MMKSILKVRANEFAPISETMNISSRGVNEAETIAAIYAQTNDYDYWELQFNRVADNSPRLVRNKYGIRRVGA